MLWLAVLAAAMVVLPSLALAVGYLRRRGASQLVAIPDELCLRLAKTVTEGEFDKDSFRRGSLSTLFPTQVSCPHCGGRRGNVWDVGRAERLLTNIGKLAREIKGGQLCLSCLGQLSNIAAGEKEHLKELDKKDPKTLSTRPRRWGRTFLLLVVASIIVILLSSLPSFLWLLARLMVNLPTIMFRY